MHFMETDAIVSRYNYSSSDPPATAKMDDLAKLARETARQNRGINFTKGIIRMRYEQ